MKHSDSVRVVAFRPDSSRIATASWDKTARLWDAQTGGTMGEPMKHDSIIKAVVFSPDGNQLATASWDKTARLWDSYIGVPVGQPMKHEWRVNSVAFSPDGRQLATASDDKTARLWDCQTIMPKNMNSFINRFAEKPDPTIPRDLEFEEELKTFLARKRFLYRSSTAVQSVAKKNWYTARFHLPWLCEQEPNNPRWKKILDEVVISD